MAICILAAGKEASASGHIHRACNAGRGRSSSPAGSWSGICLVSVAIPGVSRGEDWLKASVQIDETLAGLARRHRAASGTLSAGAPRRDCIRPSASMSNPPVDKAACPKHLVPNFGNSRGCGPARALVTGFVCPGRSCVQKALNGEEANAMKKRPCRAWGDCVFGVRGTGTQGQPIPVVHLLACVAVVSVVGLAPAVGLGPGYQPHSYRACQGHFEHVSRYLGGPAPGLHAGSGHDSGDSCAPREGGG